MILMQDSAVEPATAFVDLGYREVDALQPGCAHRAPGQVQAPERAGEKAARAASGIKPIIGHLKADHRMDRCHLKGQTGDRLHAVLCAAGYNIRWLQRMIAKKGIRALLVLLLRLLRLAKAGAISLRPGMMHLQPALG
jgi:IS5 family transposase